MLEGGSGLLAQVLDLQLLGLDVVAESAVERSGLEQREHGGDAVIALRPTGGCDGAFGADAQRGHHQHGGDVLLQLVVGGVDRRVGEAHQLQLTGWVEPEVHAVDRAVADVGLVELAEERPCIVEDLVVDGVGVLLRHVGQRVVEEVGDQHRVVERGHPDGDQCRHRHTVLIGQEQRQRLVLDLLAAVGSVLRPLVLVPGFLPQPGPPTGAPRVAAEGADENGLAIGRGPGQDDRFSRLLVVVRQRLGLQAQVGKPRLQTARRGQTGRGAEGIAGERRSEQADEQATERGADRRHRPEDRCHSRGQGEHPAHLADRSGQPGRGCSLNGRCRRQREGRERVASLVQIEERELRPAVVDDLREHHADRARRTAPPTPCLAARPAGPWRRARPRSTSRCRTAPPLRRPPATTTGAIRAGCPRTRGSSCRRSILRRRPGSTRTPGLR